MSDQNAESACHRHSAHHLRGGYPLAGRRVSDEEWEWCWHPSASGVDQADFGPDKVWCCDVCGWRYRRVPHPTTDGVSVMVAAQTDGPGSAS